jgi:hypothetical protein|tara:strand:- start:169 stop:486 length:318 start_codon:yes stop_codon:yes gene_type:complete
MVKKDAHNSIGVVNETRINTLEGLFVTITNFHLGDGVHVIRVVSEDGLVLEESGEMERKRAHGVYGDKCRYYEKGGEGNLIDISDFEEGLPDSEIITSTFHYGQR